MSSNFGVAARQFSAILKETKRAGGASRRFVRRGVLQTAVDQPSSRIAHRGRSPSIGLLTRDLARLLTRPSIHPATHQIAGDQAANQQRYKDGKHQHVGAYAVVFFGRSALQEEIYGTCGQQAPNRKQDDPRQIVCQNRAEYCAHHSDDNDAKSEDQNHGARK